MGSAGAGNTFVDEFAPGKAFGGVVPVSDRFFAHSPAEQNGLAFHFAGKIEETGVDVFHLHADGIDLGDGIFGALFGFAALGLAAGDGNDIDVRAAVQEDAMAQFLHFELDFLHYFFAVDGGAQEGFQHGKEHLSFVEGEGAAGHGGKTYCSACGAGRSSVVWSLAVGR